MNFEAVVEIEDFPVGCQDMVEIFGVDTVMELVDYCGGSMMYFPSKSAVVRSARNRVIKREFRGGNYRELSSKYGLSEMQVRNIVKLKN